VVADKNRDSAVAGSKVLKIEFFDRGDEDDLAMVYPTPEQIAGAALAGIDLLAQLRLNLPATLRSAAQHVPSRDIEDRCPANRHACRSE
jgi:hypothetical protein